MELIDNINRLLGDDLNQALKPGPPEGGSLVLLDVRLRGPEGGAGAGRRTPLHLHVATFVAEEVTDKNSFDKLMELVKAVRSIHDRNQCRY